MSCEYFKLHDTSHGRTEGLSDKNVMEIYKITPYHFTILCDNLCSNKPASKSSRMKRKKEEVEKGTIIFP